MSYRLIIPNYDVCPSNGSPVDKRDHTAFCNMLCNKHSKVLKITIFSLSTNRFLPWAMHSSRSYPLNVQIPCANPLNVQTPCAEVT